MSSIIAPRFDVPMVDPRTGTITRQWGNYLIRLAASINNSPTSADDAALTDMIENTSVESLALQGLSAAAKAHNDSMLIGFYPEDPPAKAQDNSLMAYWPGDIK